MRALLTRPPLSARDRRALARGAAILVAGLLWMVAVRPYLQAVRAVSERLETERTLLARELGLIAASSQATGEVRVLSDQLIAFAPRLIGGRNVQAATAGLTTFLEVGARQERVWLSRVEPGAPEHVGGGLVALPIRLRGEGDLEGILVLLHGIENNPKLLRIPSLAIKSSRAGLPAGREEAEVLTFEAEIRGFALDTVAIGGSGGNDGPR